MQLGVLQALHDALQFQRFVRGQRVQLGLNEIEFIGHPLLASRARQLQLVVRFDAVARACGNLLLDRVEIHKRAGHRAAQFLVDLRQMRLFRAHLVQRFFASRGAGMEVEDRHVDPQKADKRGRPRVGIATVEMGQVLADQEIRFQAGAGKLRAARQAVLLARDLNFALLYLQRRMPRHDLRQKPLQGRQACRHGQRGRQLKPFIQAPAAHQVGQFDRAIARVFNRRRQRLPIGAQLDPGQLDILRQLQ
jgi:hypothetical protein